LAGLCFGVLCYLVALFFFFVRIKIANHKAVSIPLGLAKSIVPPALIVIASFDFLGSVRAFTSDPIGSGNDTGSAPCESTELNVLSNARGQVAIARETHCQGDWDEPSTYFVFVHNIEESNTRQNLVLRYRGGWEGDGWGPPPRLRWGSPSALDIQVGGRIDRITEQQPKMDRVRISYSIAPPACPSTFNSWQRLFFHLFPTC
jgi:hypothetical protein